MEYNASVQCATLTLKLTYMHEVRVISLHVCTCVLVIYPNILLGQNVSVALQATMRSLIKSSKQFTTENMENTDGQRKLTSLPEASDDSSQNEQ